MRHVSILTDFVSHDEAYSLCSAVQAQAATLDMLGYGVAILVREGFSGHEHYKAAECIYLDHGEGWNNRLNITDKTAGEIDRLTEQLGWALEDTSAVITNDLIFQPNLFKLHVAARRIARSRPDIRWLHVVHSAGRMYSASQCGEFAGELTGRFPNSQMVAFHAEEAQRKAAAFGYDDVVIIPNAIDFAAGFHPLSKEIVSGLWDMDVVAVYPCRLDRGKQPHVVIEIFRHLVTRGYRAAVVFVDFHSTAGDKARYRDELRELAAERNVPALFTSDYEPYHVPHQVVMDLFEFGDVLIHPSRSEADPLILLEAAWKGCGLVLNFDLPLFRQWAATYGRFSSDVSALTGDFGEVETEHKRREVYMARIAGKIARQMENNPVLAMHARMRKERSLHAVSRLWWAAIEGEVDVC